MHRNWRKAPWVLRYGVGERVATSARQLLVAATHQHCRVKFEGPMRIGPGFRLMIPDRGSLVIGAGCDFRNGFTCEIVGEGSVTIGEGTIFTSHALVQVTTSLTIGRRCVFGQSVLIVDGRHRYTGLDRHWLEQGYDYEPIVIGDGVGVSDKCTIEASIGERSMIASQSVVDRPIPAFSVAAGRPARVIKYFGPEDHRPMVPSRTREP